MKPNYWVSKSSLSLHDPSDDWKNIVSILTEYSHGKYPRYKIFTLISNIQILFQLFLSFLFQLCNCALRVLSCRVSFFRRHKDLIHPREYQRFITTAGQEKHRVNRQQRGKKLRVIYLSVSSQEINFSLLLSFSTQRSEMSNNDRQAFSLSGWSGAETNKLFLLSSNSTTYATYNLFNSLNWIRKSVSSVTWGYLTTNHADSAHDGVQPLVYPNLHGNKC